MTDRGDVAEELFQAGDIDEKVAKRAETVSPKYRIGYLRAAAGKVSPREAIKAKCLDCCCWQREEVAHCTVVCCPLWRYRPFQPSRKQPHLAAEPSEGDGYAPEPVSGGLQGGDRSFCRPDALSQGVLAESRNDRHLHEH